jgi:hypothetical protein
VKVLCSLAFIEVELPRDESIARQTLGSPIEDREVDFMAARCGSRYHIMA